MSANLEASTVGFADGFGIMSDRGWSLRGGVGAVAVYVVCVGHAEVVRVTYASRGGHKRVQVFGI